MLNLKFDITYNCWIRILDIWYTLYFSCIYFVKEFMKLKGLDDYEIMIMIDLVIEQGNLIWEFGFHYTENGDKLLHVCKRTNYKNEKPLSLLLPLEIMRFWVTPFFELLIILLNINNIQTLVSSCFSSLFGYLGI